MVAGAPLTVVSVRADSGFFAGVSPSGAVGHLRKDQNSLTLLRIENATNGTAARAAVQVRSDLADNGGIYAYSSGYTGTADWAAAVTVEAANAYTGGLVLFSPQKVRIQNTAGVDVVRVSGGAVRILGTLDVSQAALGSIENPALMLRGGGGDFYALGFEATDGGANFGYVPIFSVGPDRLDLRYTDGAGSEVVVFRIDAVGEVRVAGPIRPLNSPGDLDLGALGSGGNVKVTTNGLVRAYFHAMGALLMGTTVTTGAAAGDVVLAFAKSLRSVDSAGTGTFQVITGTAVSGNSVVSVGDAAARLYVRSVDFSAGAIQRVTAGAADSAGAGFRQLRIPN